MATMIRTFNEFPLFLSMVNTAPNYFLAMVSANNPQTICKLAKSFLQSLAEIDARIMQHSILHYFLPSVI
ncbi:hypothetical protein NC652_013400 [Populus alba x Populus x berolinensis]|nr:hypothetical protein NC652_013400 [Populus alba x Populus x berolinensis]